MLRADKRTRTEVATELYSDFTINFDRNPVTGALAKVTNDEAVKRSLMQIVLVDREEWAYHLDLGSKVKRLLFEPLDPQTALMLRDVITEACTLEPRATVVGVEVRPDQTNDGYRINIFYYTVNATQVQNLNTFLKRVR